MNNNKQVNFHKLLEAKLNEIKYYQISLKKEAKFKRLLFNSFITTYSNLLLNMTTCFDFYACIDKKQVTDVILNRFIYFLDKPVENVPYRFQKLIILLHDYYLNNVTVKKIIGFFNQPAYIGRGELFKNYTCTLNTVLYDLYYLMILIKEIKVNCNSIKRLDYSNKIYYNTFMEEQVCIVLAPEILNVDEYIKNQIEALSNMLLSTSKIQLNLILLDSVNINIDKGLFSNFKRVEVRKL